MNLKHMVILVIILVGSDLVIGMYGHFKGTGETDFFEYLTAEDTKNELFVVFLFAISIVMIMHYFLRIG